MFILVLLVCIMQGLKECYREDMLVLSKSITSLGEMTALGLAEYGDDVEFLRMVEDTNRMIAQAQLQTQVRA